MKTNKYQEALKELEHTLSAYTKDWMLFSHLFILHEDIKELVDRSTPMKPVRKEVIGAFYFIDTCPICGIEVNPFKCCSKNDCRQAIDWSEIENIK